MKLIAALGNPGSKYRNTRHNAGTLAGVWLAEKHGIPLKDKKFNSITGKGRIAGTEAVLLIPQTYMNNSGQAVASAVSFYKLEPADIIVLHDEIEMPFGEVRVKDGGGHRGHNGLRSIMQHIDSGEFHRIRIGVGRPESEHITVADHVLGKFSGQETSQLQEIYEKTEALLLNIL